jgi:hypothetical protein
LIWKLLTKKLININIFSPVYIFYILKWCQFYLKKNILKLSFKLWQSTSETSVRSQSFMSSDARWFVVRVLERQAQKWTRVTRNKTVRAVRSKMNNIRQIRLGYYIWYQSRGRFVLRWGDYDIPHQKRASKAKILWVVLVADLLYVFWSVRLRNELTSPETKPQER